MKKIMYIFLILILGAILVFTYLSKNQKEHIDIIDDTERKISGEEESRVNNENEDELKETPEEQTEGKVVVNDNKYENEVKINQEIESETEVNTNNKEDVIKTFFVSLNESDVSKMSKTIYDGFDVEGWIVSNEEYKLTNKINKIEEVEQNMYLTEVESISGLSSENNSITVYKLGVDENNVINYFEIVEFKTKE